MVESKIDLVGGRDKKKPNRIVRGVKICKTLECIWMTVSVIREKIELGAMKQSKPASSKPAFCVNGESHGKQIWQNGLLAFLGFKCANF